LARPLARHLKRTAAVIAPLLSALRGSDCSTTVDDGIIDALCISLVEAVVEARERGEVRDLPTLDLIARELLDFPRHACSMCTWMKRERVARALEGGARVRSLVTDSALARARAFVDAGRELYR
jgi:hypothetical protein